MSQPQKSEAPSSSLDSSCSMHSPCCKELLADFILNGKAGKKRPSIFPKEELPLAQAVCILWLFLGQITMAKKMGTSTGQT